MYGYFSHAKVIKDTVKVNDEPDVRLFCVSATYGLVPVNLTDMLVPQRKILVAINHIVGIL